MNFEVIRQTIRRTDSAPVIADSINYLTAKFRFSSDWADLEKHVTFTLGTNVYDKTLDADDEIKANQGLNLTEGVWTVGVVGVEVVEGEVIERITADTVSILVTMAGALGGEAFPEISGAFGEIILQSEADRVAAEAARVAAEEEREAYYAAAQTGFEEEARVTAENLRVEAENDREIAEEARESWYQDAQTGFDEAARVSAENLRIEAESARSIAEGLRDSSEQSRDSAEGLRVTAEQGRDTAEGLRVTAESGRDIAEGLRVTAEQERDIAEGLRDTAEQARDSAEGLRIAAESARAFYAAYSGTTSYILGNKVSYNGSSYIWTDDDPSVAGTQPPNTGWLLIASRGDDGTSGVYVGSDPIPEGYNVQIDPDGDATDVVLQFGTMPTPDADYLGVTALYTGATGTYKNGGTYICVSSGGATPVYSWSRVGEDVSGAISAHNTDAGAHGLSDKFVHIFDNVLVFSSSTFSQHTAYIAPTMVFNSDGFVYTRGQVANYVIKFAFSTEIGETYHIDFSLMGTITEAVVSNSLYGYSGGAVKATLVLAAGVYSCQFVADTATSYLYFSIPFSSATITVFDALGYKETETGNVYLNTDFIKDAGIPLSKLEPQDVCNYQGGELQMFKKILCIGDSLTSGVFDHYVGATLEYFTDANYAYPTYLKALTGRDTGNLGVGGATFAQWYTTHALTDVSGYDCAIIALGLNDAVYATTSGDRLAAMASIVTKIKTANTGIKIFMANILPYYNNANVTAVNADIASFADATSDVYLMDIHTNGSVAENAAYRAGHLTAIGYQRLAKDYFCYASYLISTNMSDFRFVQYIGTAYEYTA